MSTPSVELGEISNIQIGPFGSLLHKSDYVEDGIPVINPMHIAPDGIAADYSYSVPTSKADELTRYLLSAGEIIMGRRGEMGRCAVVQAEHVGMICGTGSMKIIPQEKRLNPEYLVHMIRTPKARAELENAASGVTMLNLNAKALAKLKIPLPPLEEQKRIAGILDQADALRRLRTRALEKLGILGQAIFHEMFGDEIGKDVELKELGRVQTGSTPSTKQPEYFDGNIPFVTPGDLESDRPFARFVSEAGAKNSRTVAEGATFVCCIGATIGKMGMSKSRSAFNQQINSIEWGDTVLPAFGYFAMQMIREEIIHIGKGAATTLPILKKSLFEKMKVRVVELDQQREFISRYNQTEKMIASSENGLKYSETLFASLQHSAFRGEL